MTAPQNAAEAAQQLNDLIADRREAVDWQERMDRVAARSEKLYRREAHKALLTNRDGGSADIREALRDESKVSGDTAAEGCLLLEAMRLDPAKVGEPATVGDLRYVRDLAASAAERAKQSVRDLGDLRRAWITVASMARAEADYVRTGGEQ